MGNPTHPEERAAQEHPTRSQGEGQLKAMPSLRVKMRGPSFIRLTKWSKLDAMTIQTDRVQEIFQDARFLQAAAVDRLTRGISGTPQRRHGEQPSAPPTPSSWPGRGKRPEPDDRNRGGTPEAAILGPTSPQRQPAQTLLRPPSRAPRPVFLQRPVRSPGRHRATSPPDQRLHRRRPASSRHSLTSIQSHRPPPQAAGTTARSGQARGQLRQHHRPKPLWNVTHIN